MTRADQERKILKILVAGSAGQLARSLAAAALHDPGVKLTALGRPELDLLGRTTLEQIVDRVRPDIVINTAAYTAVDRAEAEPEVALAVNRDGAAALAAAACRHGAPIIHVSTDYVFDGAKQEPYRETDHPAPETAYGRSKLEGEQAVAEANPRHVILRTSWVYSEYGSNFVKTMLRLGGERPELRVVADQFGNPTYAGDLADAILNLTDQLARGESAWGIYHLAGNGDTTWHGFAERIIACGVRHGLMPVPVLPISTSGFPTPAKRPANSRLDCAKARAVFGISLPCWTVAVTRCIEHIYAARGERERHGNVVEPVST
jgi:dTDP-4-dehydrorhamnose reductase